MEGDGGRDGERSRQEMRRWGQGDGEKGWGKRDGGKGPPGPDGELGAPHRPHWIQREGRGQRPQDFFQSLHGLLGRRSKQQMDRCSESHRALTHTPSTPPCPSLPAGPQVIVPAPTSLSHGHTPRWEWPPTPSHCPDAQCHTHSLPLLMPNHATLLLVTPTATRPTPHRYREQAPSSSAHL